MSVETGFIADTHQGAVIVHRTGPTGKLFRMSMAPSEVARAKQLVNLALSMIELPAIPEFITNSPFVVRFFGNGVCALEREDESASIPFRAAEGDKLVNTLEMALGICLNEQTQGRTVGSVGLAMPAGLAGNEPL